LCEYTLIGATRSPADAGAPGSVTRTTFVDAPAVVRELVEPAVRAEIDLLPGLLAEVCDVQVAVGAIE